MRRRTFLAGVGAAGLSGFVGPGHNAVVRDDAGDDWLLYYAYEEGEGYIEGTPRRLLMLDRIDWSDGWLKVGDSRTQPLRRVTLLCCERRNSTRSPRREGSLAKQRPNASDMEPKPPSASH